MCTVRLPFLLVLCPYLTAVILCMRVFITLDWRQCHKAPHAAVAGVRPRRHHVRDGIGTTHRWHHYDRTVQALLFDERLQEVYSLLRGCLMNIVLGLAPS